MSAPKRSAAPSHLWRWRRFAIAVPVMLTCGGLSAQQAPYVQYGPLATSIPTLSGWAFLLLAMFMLAAVWHMKRKDRYQGSKFLIISLTVGALASAASGVQLVSNANALPPSPFNNVPLDLARGGIAPLEPFTLNCVVNVTAVAQQIIKIDRNTNGGAPSQTTNPQGTGNFGSCSAVNCTVEPSENVLQPDAKCIIDLRNPA